MTTTTTGTSTTSWWKDLTPYHWFVFAMASMAWVFDCLDQQVFILARYDALKDLLPAKTDGPVITQYAGYATSIFMIGWATGGLIFGSIGDRIGRARTLAITVLLYSVFTGLSAFSRGPIDFFIYRFITGLGVGGVFGLAVALVADSLPERSRTPALGLLQALSAFGNITAGIMSIVVGQLGASGRINPASGWKIMFLFGALPAFLCVFIQFRLKEPEKWVNARREGNLTGVKFGSYRDLFSDPRWSRSALGGMLLCVAGVIGVWGIGFFAPELINGVIELRLKEADPTVSPDTIKSTQATWKGINGIIQNTGAFFGMIAFTFLCQRIGRKKSFAIGFIAAMIATIAFFRLFNGTSMIWLSAVMGFFQLALFAGFAVYLPELFPTRLRSTGTSFCYNVGRYVAASGPITLGELAKYLAPKDAPLEQKLQAFRDACTYMSLFFLVGLIALAFLPETKGKPLPE
ncbi:MAG: MFS transporter [Planctomycetota bacterium]